MSMYARALPIVEAAERLGISESTLRRRIAAGSIRMVDLGGRIRRISPQEIDRLLNG